MDVVYNHYDESDVDVATGSIGEIFSLRGLDNTSYYEIAYVAVEGSAGAVTETAGRLTFDLAPRAVTSAAFAKLADPAR